MALTEPSAPEAATLLADVLAEARRTGDSEVEVLALDALARRRADAGDLDAAAATLALADAAMAGARLRVTDADRIDARELRHLIP